MADFSGPYRGTANGFSPAPSASSAINGRAFPGMVDGYGNNNQEHIRQMDVNNGNKPNGLYNKNGKNVVIHRPRLNRKSPLEEKKSSNLTTKFDPMKDRHMWAMWRTAVNGRIVDQVLRNEQFKQESALSEDFSTAVGSDSRTSTYGKDLASNPPLSRFIRLNQRSKNIAQELMNEGHGMLETTQFIYYGLPRVTANSSLFNRNNNFNGSNHINDNAFENGGPEFNPYTEKRT